MTQGSRSNRRARWGGVIAAVAILTAISAVPALGAPDGKTFTAAATSAVHAGQETTVTVTLTNTSSQQSLGSANINVPDALNVGYPSPRVIELRTLGLEPGDSVDVDIAVRAQCAEALGNTWQIDVKQSNDFNGTGNDLLLDGPPATTDVTGDCSLDFTTEPADTERLQVITGDAYYFEDPGVVAEPYAGDGTGLSPVTVSVVDGSGAAPVVWWTDPITLSLGSDASGGSATLSGTATTGQSAGSATFAPSLDVSADGYTLIGATSGLASTESGDFSIVDDADYCAAGSSCSASSSKGGTSATINASPGSVAIPLTVSIDPADLVVVLDAAACQGHEGISGTVQFFVEDEDRTKTVTVTVDGSLVDRPLNKFEVCFASPEPFTTKDGSESPDSGYEVDGQTIYAGLLPDCALPAPGPPGTNPPPCVQERSRDNKTKAVTVTFLAPASDSDPWGKIG